jgi:hypothetical protein
MYEERMVRLVLMVSPSMVPRLDDHMHDNRLRNRSDAVRDLLERALDGVPTTPRPGEASSPAITAEPLDGEPKPLPRVEVPHDQNNGPVPMVVQWLNKAIRTEKRGRFTEDEIFRGAWRKPDNYALAPKDRKTLAIGMEPTGWARTTVRAGRAPGDPLHVWSAPGW